jgi:hypothetical protein
MNHFLEWNQCALLGPFVCSSVVQPFRTWLIPRECSPTGEVTIDLECSRLSLSDQRIQSADPTEYLTLPDTNLMLYHLPFELEPAIFFNFSPPNLHHSKETRYLRYSLVYLRSMQCCCGDMFGPSTSLWTGCGHDIWAENILPNPLWLSWNISVWHGHHVRLMDEPLIEYLAHNFLTVLPNSQLTIWRVVQEHTRH